MFEIPTGLMQRQTSPVVIEALKNCLFFMQIMKIVLHPVLSILLPHGRVNISEFQRCGDPSRGESRQFLRC
jgi:hypothetical protein